MPKSQAKISVVLATFNGATYFEEQLQSVVLQTHSIAEIIIVDDGSTDKTAAIAKNFSDKFDHISFHPNHSNLGLTANFARGFALATGDLIAPCDQDDIWHPDKLSRMVAQMGDHELIYHDSTLINASGESLHQNLSDRKEMWGFDDPLTYTIGGSAPGHAMLFKRELLTRCFPFPDNIPFDYWLGYVATLQKPIQFIPEALVQYRMHDNNAFGVKVKGANTHRRSSKNESNEKLRAKLQTLADKCPNDHPRKPVFKALVQSYQSFSPANNLKRMMLFFRYRDKILQYKKKSAWRKWLFCVKTFFRLQ